MSDNNTIPPPSSSSPSSSSSSSSPPPSSDAVVKPKVKLLGVSVTSASWFNHVRDFLSAHSSEGQFITDDGYNISYPQSVVKPEPKLKTRPWVFDKAFHKAYQAVEFEEFERGVSEGIDNLRYLEIFKDDQTSIQVEQVEYDEDTDEEDMYVSDKHGLHPRYPVKIRLFAEEKNTQAAKVEMKTEYRTGELLTKVSYRYRNLLGLADRYDFNYTHGSCNSSALNLSYTHPSLFLPRSTFSASFFRQTNSHTTYTSLLEHVQGLRLSFLPPANSTSNPFFPHHDLSWEVSSRVLEPTPRPVSDQQRLWNRLNQEPSLSALHASGIQSIKSSVKYAHTWNRLDHPFLPTKGAFIQSSMELAGLGGDAQFAKVSTDIKYAVPLHPRISLQFSGLFGFIKPLSFLSSLFSSRKSSTVPSYSDHHPIFYTDRLFSGSALTLRGFEAASIGPKDQDDYTGGELSANLGASVNFSYDDLASAGVRGHVFVNAGNVVSLYGANQSQTCKDRPLGSYFDALSNRPDWRLSVGTGLVFRTPFGRLEFNVCHPISAQTTDLTSKWQFGLGMNFS